MSKIKIDEEEFKKFLIAIKRWMYNKDELHTDSIHIDEMTIKNGITEYRKLWELPKKSKFKQLNLEI